MRLVQQVCLLALVAGTLPACGPDAETPSLVRSLTDDDFAGEKYYFGWGAANSGDPSMMHNEVRYDVQHTHDIFTNQVGGSYDGHTEIGPQVNRSIIQSQWRALGAQMTADDMYVQYSSGHGSPTGLGVGVSYNEIRDNALAYPAKEIVIFTMACRSGGLVNAFNNVRSTWEGWGAQGRTLLVMSSSSVSQDSSTGPGRDPDEPNGPSGSAGSAFGHALWKSLIGYSDGYVDGVKDGYVTLEEIIEYSKARTQDIGGHMPVLTGVYDPQLVMNRVPPRSFVEAMEYTTEGLTDAEVMDRVAALDQAMRLQ